MNVNNNWTLFGSSLFRTFTDSALTGEANTHITGSTANMDSSLASVVMAYLFAVVDISPPQTVTSSESLQPLQQLF